MLTKRTAAVLLLLIAVAFAATFPFTQKIPQSQDYHNFADHRAWLGLPNFGNVASNLPFAIVGAAGWVFLADKSSRRRFVVHRERWPYFCLFVGLLWTAFGSAYYHLSPSNARLMWDRLPMTVVFMPLVAAMIMERLDVAWGLRLLPVLMTMGIASVIQWRFSELRGVGDLRFYAVVQLYSVIALVILLFVPPRYTRSSDFFWVILLYAAAKIFESADRLIFQFGHFVSGHTLKHLAAAAAGYFILRMLQKREPLPASVQPLL
jgi:hypothetical protein